MEKLILRLVASVMVIVAATGCSSVSSRTVDLRNGEVLEVSTYHRTAIAGDDHVVVQQRVRPPLSDEQIAEVSTLVRDRVLLDNPDADEDTLVTLTSEKIEELRKEQVVSTHVRVDTGPGLGHDLVKGVSAGVAGGATAGIVGAIAGGGGDAVATATSNSNSSANAQANAP